MGSINRDWSWIKVPSRVKYCGARFKPLLRKDLSQGAMICPPISCRSWLCEDCASNKTREVLDHFRAVAGDEVAYLSNLPLYSLQALKKRRQRLEAGSMAIVGTKKKWGWMVASEPLVADQREVPPIETDWTILTKEQVIGFLVEEVFHLPKVAKVHFDGSWKRDRENAPSAFEDLGLMLNRDQFGIVAERTIEKIYRATDILLSNLFEPIEDPVPRSLIKAIFVTEARREKARLEAVVDHSE